jgi:hypothetical protein
MRAPDISGKRFGRLVAIARIGIDERNNALWRCQCDCGATAVIAGSNMRRGATSSCGCLRRETSSAQSRKHGLAGIPEWRIWSGMRARCSNPNNKAYKWYGARGIKVCERWCGPDGFMNFIADMGRRPSPNLSIDRIDNDGNYEPGNCRWATAKQQSQNRRVCRKQANQPISVGAER